MLPLPDDIDARLEALMGNYPVGEVARRTELAYGYIVCLTADLGLSNSGTRQPAKIKRGIGFTKGIVLRHIKALESFKGDLKQYCNQSDLNMELFTKSMQHYDAAFWERYKQANPKLPVKVCPQCEVEFVPYTVRKVCCSQKCSRTMVADKEYFGGNRSNTIGLTQGICQMCEKPRTGLASHHVLGKENDPDNKYLVALCSGCHKLVTMLGVRNDANKNEFWENLMNLVLLRKYGKDGFNGCVSIEKMVIHD